MLELRLEEVARSTLLAVKLNINAAIDDVWATMAAEDATFYAAMGEPVPATPKPYPARFFLGSYPSVLERPAVDYPNIAVVSYKHRSAEDAGDQYETANNTIYVEAFVMHEDEGTVNRLAWRYARALHQVLARYRTVEDPDVFAADFTPAIDISNAAIRRKEQFSEDLTYIQGCRLEWDLKTVGTW